MSDDARQPAHLSASVSDHAPIEKLHEFALRLAVQVDSAQCEIGEAREILKDAIDRLMPAFTAQRSGDAQPMISPSRREAFSALQFQDISDQLLAHAQTRLNHLLSEVQTLTAALEPSAAREVGAEQLSRLVDAANDNLAGLDLTLLKPVANAHLRTGDAEFF